MANYLVIAASSAIGQSVTTHLKSRGDRVFTTARDNRKIKPDFILDACDFDAVAEVFHKIGTIDGVVNCAGSLLLKSAHTTTVEEFQASIDASLKTSFATIRAAGLMMKEGGSVVLISSAAALVGLANHEAVAAAKAGIIGLAQAAAATYAPNNLRVNVIAPGMVNTPLTASLVNNQFALNASKMMHALGRIGTPEDIAQAILFLLSPETSWITGQVLAVDGGLSRVRPKMKI
ncbi:SDR family NAD(P)-dependent oxidoreductase [Legionella micdadei]|uniref:NAD(P)-dependent dehydrogenase, short-chain alcohol dehydrogenase family n=1 Tax=Legionella micdadei TaxID=451 RepID=A0A098GKY4_LEGMI|nr:SDR family oxidoreductase [Legionella micdadei]ARG98578.1 2-deoxy-D-gluconate 3-dehydrogenase [Legionella micdadei]ARH01322.1 2-deoxy-D-gluconate 3-dehydrogenase [Legionella micdadei]KTD27438.1 oxydoreductase [Legionella micdadei]NSL19352.1 SDR family oxidoreductase [Legionella micdadei]CEG62146.1 Short chain dehydrogenase/reductase family oxidoreductase [Legionella micdadei]